jgi:hypothetical protein
MPGRSPGIGGMGGIGGIGGPGMGGPGIAGPGVGLPPLGRMGGSIGGRMGGFGGIGGTSGSWQAFAIRELMEYSRMSFRDTMMELDHLAQMGLVSEITRGVWALDPMAS